MLPKLDDLTEKQKQMASDLVEQHREKVRSLNANDAFAAFVLLAATTIITTTVFEENTMKIIHDSVRRVLSADEPGTNPGPTPTTGPTGPSPGPTPGNTPAPTPPAPVPITGNPIERGDPPLKQRYEKCRIIGIGSRSSGPLPQHRTYGSVYGA